MLFTGRTEFLEKASLPAAELASRGFCVASVDWRGQGLSDRLLDEPRKGHIDTFESYHRDIDALLSHPSVAGRGRPRLLLAHSMGGAISIGAMLRGRLEVDAAVLSAPMLAIRMSGAARAVVGLLGGFARVTGRLDGWLPNPNPGRPYVFEGFEDNVLTSDREVFDWMAGALRRNPALQLGTPTMGWMSAAAAEGRWIGSHGTLGCPALVLLGSEEEVVDPDAVRKGAKRLGGELVEIEGGRHELLIEAARYRSEAWAAIDRFLENTGI